MIFAGERGIAGSRLIGPYFGKNNIRQFRGGEVLGILDALQRILGINPEEYGDFEGKPVFLAPEGARPGDPVRIEYRGLLKKSGADEIFLHYAFDGWNPPIRTARMEKNTGGDFKIIVRADGDHEMNFCFRDASGNWDNNNGQNWNLHLH